MKTILLSLVAVCMFAVPAQAQCNGSNGGQRIYISNPGPIQRLFGCRQQIMIQQPSCVQPQCVPPHDHDDDDEEQILRDMVLMQILENVKGNINPPIGQQIQYAQPPVQFTMPVAPVQPMYYRPVGQQQRYLRVQVYQR